jgi:hypothetical protein
LVLLAALYRLIPHPPNFAPITALALFGGAEFANKSEAFFVPLAAIFLSESASLAPGSIGSPASRAENGQKAKGGLS